MWLLIISISLSIRPDNKGPVTVENRYVAEEYWLGLFHCNKQINFAGVLCETGI